MWLAIAVGGACGAMARHAVNPAIGVRGLFPAGIFVVNALGCLAIGLLAGLVASQRLTFGDTARAFLFVGVLGGFTTFSSFGLDTFTLLRAGHPGLAALNAAGQMLVGLLAVALGFAVGAWRT